ncbi:AMP-binding protein [Bacillus cytotoxicus]
MFGGTVCPVHKDVVRNPWRLARWIIETRISVMHFVPSLFGEFIHSIEDKAYHFPNLRWLIFSGEALPASVIKKMVANIRGKYRLSESIWANGSVNRCDIPYY